MSTYGVIGRELLHSISPSVHVMPLNLKASLEEWPVIQEMWMFRRWNGETVVPNCGYAQFSRHSDY